MHSRSAGATTEGETREQSGVERALSCLLAWLSGAQYASLALCYALTVTVCGYIERPHFRDRTREESKQCENDTIQNTGDEEIVVVISFMSCLEAPTLRLPILVS